MFSRFRGILLAALLFVCSCTSTDENQQKIRSVLEIRIRALNTRDSTNYLSVISPHYNDKGKQFAQLKDSLEKNLSESEQLSYVAEKATITINGSTAEAVSNYRLKIRVRGKELNFSGKEHLTLALEPNGWKIIAGI